jgi:hypothetical protein
MKRLTHEQGVYVSQLAYFLCTASTKLTFLFFFLRIFPLKVVRNWCFIGIGSTVAYLVSSGLTMAFACWPISGKLKVDYKSTDADSHVSVWAGWSKEATPKYCIDQNIFFLTASGVNIVIDILIALIPMPHLWRLSLSVRKKLMLIAIFCVGFV